MAYERSKSGQNNFAKLIHQLQPKTKTLVWELEGILIKLYRQNVFLLFNQTYLNEELLPNIYIYIYTPVTDSVHMNIYVNISSRTLKLTIVQG